MEACYSEFILVRNVKKTSNVKKIKYLNQIFSLFNVRMSNTFWTNSSNSGHSDKQHTAMTSRAENDRRQKYLANAKGFHCSYVGFIHQGFRRS